MLINSCSIEPGISDHDILLVVICTKIPKPVLSDRKLYLWNRANFDETRSKFSDISQEFFNQHTVDTPIEDLWHSLCSLLKFVLDEFVPSKIITGVSKKPWINRTIKQLRQRKQRQYNLAKQTNCERQWKY